MKLLELPSKRHDLNPIEYLWTMLNSQVKHGQETNHFI